MTFVITEACIDIKDGRCTAVCPVECIYEGGRMYYIHPDECVSCGLCESVCPVDAIHSVAHLPPALDPYIAVNRDFFGPEVTGWGSPMGWDADHTTDLDHPLVTAHPQRAAAET